MRGNRFLACQGELSLRTARRVLVQNNIFDGQGRENTGGVAFARRRPCRGGNTFRDLKNPKDYYAWPISLMAADLETYGETDQLGGYGRTRDILITRKPFRTTAINASPLASTPQRVSTAAEEHRRARECIWWYGRWQRL